MRAPEFWHKDGFAARLLEPVGLVYAALTRHRVARPPGVRLGIPVVCVGNLTAGGAGKTPVALAVMDALRRRGVAGHFLSRGYGGKMEGPVAVDPVGHGPEDVGDEPLLLANSAPCWVSRNRASGGLVAEGAGAQAVVMDDGHQNPSLAKDLSLVVVDGGYGFGNGRYIPAGPLRESIEAGLARAGAVILIGSDSENLAARIPPHLQAGVPLLTARLEPGPEAARLVGRKVVAFAGIGRPEKFFATLTALGARVVARHPFADHYPYAEADIQPILDEAYGLGAVPVTTSKDAVRLPPDQRPQVDVVGVRVVFDEPLAFEALIDRLILGRLPS
ncbi:tetraacyldisaccharide 4'-kinase [Rhodospirillum rubrum]|uniref:tetraacyldisaccharide 4'-kinase n=1 Tax=Rhodospirillum rubrum TaxID=1085 RepID=UPI0019034855|nr:tetraacyldisaccharide 4'-kinase [Rhodospirillum rubrum]MBK1664438.1 tetraacyldisaccharide 4'-kinase [Rhodospirillum rubrum]MBK1675312.1 tetraacyldisaccharide 4'-kinase [Rhodospirillum rubrum]